MVEEPDVVESWGAVHPEHQGRGIGTTLLDRIEERALGLAAAVALTTDTRWAEPDTADVIVHVVR